MKKLRYKEVYKVSWDLNPGRQVPEIIYTMMPLDIIGSMKGGECLTASVVEPNLIWRIQFPLLLIGRAAVSLCGMLLFSQRDANILATLKPSMNLNGNSENNLYAFT